MAEQTGILVQFKLFRRTFYEPSKHKNVQPSMAICVTDNIYWNDKGQLVTSSIVMVKL